jgi:colanic acid/amylovoran biosynthesis glycosyltransferase
MINVQASSMRIGYLINQYPLPNHAFIRREILELEREGVEVVRIALLGWTAPVVDEQNGQEQRRTLYVQKLGCMKLISTFLSFVVAAPLAMASAVGLVLRGVRSSSRSLLVHLFYLVEACTVASIIRKERIQHLHAHFGTNSAEIAMLACCLAKKTYSFTVHGPEEFDKATSLGLVTKIERSAFVVAISSFGRGQLFRWLTPAHWNKVKVVHCGLEPEFHDHAVPGPGSAKRLVCVGRLSEQKGQLLLIQAAQLLVQRGLDFELILAGDGELRERLGEEIRVRGLDGKVALTGWLSSAQVREQILNSTALVLPSLAEGLPVAIMEAMALRRPILSTYVAGIPELVRPGVNGWLFPAGSAEDLANAMEACLTSTPGQLERMGDAARSSVLKRHDIRFEAKKLITHFGEVINSAAT